MSDSDQRGKGRRIVLVINIATLSLSAAVTLTFLVVQGSERLSQQWIRFVLTVILALNLHWGASWARRLAIMIFLLGGVLGLVNLLAVREINIGVVLMTALCATYLASAMTLLASPSVHAHFGGRARPSEGFRQEHRQVARSLDVQPPDGVNAAQQGAAVEDRPQAGDRG